MNRFLTPFYLLTLFTITQNAVAVEEQVIKIVYVTQQQKVPAALSNLDEFIQFKGLKGAALAVLDNNTTGQFTGQKFELTKIKVPVDESVVQAVNQQVTDDTFFVVTNLPAAQLLELANHEKLTEKLFFDATTTDDALRNHQCRLNILHLLPSRAMRADALAQYMMKKRWKKWMLVKGMTQADELYAAAVKRAVKRFGIKLVAEKQWTHTYDARRTAQSDVPVFTQGEEYDVLVVADEQGLFGEYFEYRTWVPRPVIGTQGLVATAWHRTHEQWGAVQIQNRFKEQEGRWMEEQDYGAYLAVRAIGEAAVRTQSNKMQLIKDYLLGDQFALQGYKGKPLSFRSWNGQLRQPVLLSAARSLVDAAPIEGFLHPISEMDTLGYDLSESSCMKGSTTSALIVEEQETKQVGQSKIGMFKQKLMNKLKQLGWR